MDINIKNKRIHSVYRAADMLCIDIGRAIKKKIGKNMRMVAEYSLHIQCPWAIQDLEKLILASGDIYEPYDIEADEDWEWDQFSTKDEEKNLFDYKVDKMESTLTQCVIERIDTDVYGNIKLVFDNGWSFCTFIDSSRKREFWRFIDFHTGKQMVQYEEQEYLTMKYGDLKKLDTNLLYDAVSEILEFKIEEKQEDFGNSYVKTFYIIECFLKEMNQGGLNQYLCSLSGKYAEDLHEELISLGFSELAQVYMELVTENKVDIEKAKLGDYEYYESLMETIPFSDFDSKFATYKRRLEERLMDFMQENLEKMI